VPCPSRWTSSWSTPSAETTHAARALALDLGAVLNLPTVDVMHRPLVAQGNWPLPSCFGRNRARFGAPERRYRGRTICVRGYVDTYRGIPEIEARLPSQIRIVG
jgi:hypothetical protein